MVVRFFLSVSMIVLTIGSAIAGANLDVKPGLWKITTTQKMSGMPQMPEMPQEVLDQMTPEMKAQMEQAMKMASGESTTKITQECISQKDLDEGDLLAEQDSQCRNEIVDQSSNRLQIKMSCGDSNEGIIIFEAPDDETIKGQIEILGDGEGAQIAMSMTVTGQWLGVNCSGAD